MSKWEIKISVNCHDYFLLQVYKPRRRWYDRDIIAIHHPVFANTMGEAIKDLIKDVKEFMEIYETNKIHIDNEAGFPDKELKKEIDKIRERE